MPEAISDAQPSIESEPLIQAYVPFPSFKSWSQGTADFSAFDMFAKQIEDLKANSDTAMLDDAVSTATKWAASNTGAIEGLYEIDRGFTYSIAVSSVAWTEIRKLKGDFAADSMQDAVRAYDFVLDAATGSYPITETWIRELHEIVTASQMTYTVLTGTGLQEQDLPKGVYKNQPNSPLNLAKNVVHSYASPLDTPPEMQRLIEEVNSPDFNAAHPALQASYAHYAFVCVHPFADGNGRVSRALASTFLYRSPGVPLVIFADQKGDYLDALELADGGDNTAFIRFVTERAIDTIGMVQAQLASASEPDVATQLRDLAPLLSGKDGLPHTEIDAIATRLYDSIDDAFEAQVRANPLSQGLTATVQRADVGGRVRIDGFREVPGNPKPVYVNVSSPAPAQASTTRSYTIAIAKPGTEGPDFVCQAEGEVILEILLREIYPVVRSAFTYRAEAMALREVRRMVASTAAKAEKSLRDAGYL
jgi:Fic family protein